MHSDAAADGAGGEPTECHTCGRTFLAPADTARYCSDECLKKDGRRRGAATTWVLRGAP